MQVIGRILHMEQLYDAVWASAKKEPDWTENADVQKMMAQLMDYYDSGLWLEDYERDERGELPKMLKRGVLSQDGLYDLIGLFHETMKERSEKDNVVALCGTVGGVCSADVDSGEDRH